jgi:subtilisin family serine protease
MKTKKVIKTNIFLVSLLALLLSFGNLAYCVVLDNGASQEEQLTAIDRIASREETGKKTPEYVPGEVIVKLKAKEGLQLLSEMSDSERAAKDANTLSRLKSKHNLHNERPVFESLHNKLKNPNTILKAQQVQNQANKVNLLPIYVLKTNRDVLETCSQLNEDPDVEYAQPNYIMELYMVPDDPYYRSSGSWGQGYDDLWGIKKIGCENAWDISQGETVEGESIVVAVLDTGVDYTHEDLAENIWVNPGEVPGDGIDNDGNGYIDDIRGWDFSNRDNDPADDIGHGSHCAGTIAAVGNNGKGVIGVAPAAKIMAVKIFPLASTTVCVQAIEYAASNGAHVLSNSWGPGGRRPSDPALEEAIDYAYSFGCVVIFAAGNYNDDVSYYSPANYSKTITVAASTQNDEKCYFSNYGPMIDVSAPGGGYASELSSRGLGICNILSTVSSDSYYGQKFRMLEVTNGYFCFSGTSMACPHVAGLAALIMSEHPEFDNDDVKNIIRISARDSGISGFDDNFGYGRIQAEHALNMENPPEYNDIIADITHPSYGETVPGGFLTIIGSATGEDFSYYLLEVGYKEKGEAGWRVIQEGYARVDNGVLGVLDAQDFYGAYRIRLTVYSSDYSTCDIAKCRWGGWPFYVGETFNAPAVCSPAIGDINGDGDVEVLFCARADAKLYCLDKKGRKIWEYQTRDDGGNDYISPNAVPAIADLDGDGPLGVDVLVIAGLQEKLYCVDAYGDMRWVYYTGALTNTSPMVADLDGDGNSEILLCAEDLISCIDKEGQLLWDYQVTGGDGVIDRITPAIADLDGNGKSEIVVATRGGVLHCITHDGQRRWICPGAGRLSSPPTIADLDGDGPRDMEIFVGSYDGKLFCIDKNGQVSWAYQVVNDVFPFHMPFIYTSPAIGDLDRDGSSEILIGTHGGKIYCIDGEGGKIWERQMSQSTNFILGATAIANFVGDPDLEVICTGWHTSMVYCIDKDGQVIWEGWFSQVGGSVPPAVADLDNNGLSEILIGGYGLFCLSGDGEDFIADETGEDVTIDLFPWPMFQRDLQHTGCYVPPTQWQNYPPVLDPIGDKEVDEGQMLVFTVSAYDPNVEDTMVWTVKKLPEGAVFRPPKPIYPLYSSQPGDIIDTGSEERLKVRRIFIWTPTYDQAGTYEITFKVEDIAASLPNDLNDTETITITVNNVTPAQLTGKLIDLVKRMNLHQGTENSLVSKLEGVIASLDKGNDTAALKKLNAFIEQVEEETGITIIEKAAYMLIRDAKFIIWLIEEGI